MRVLYLAILTLVIPLGLPLVLLGSVIRPHLRKGLAERLTLRLPTGPRGRVWIHAASLGEMKLALVLAHGLEQHGLSSLLTTNTVAGWSVARTEGVRAWFAPLDHPLLAGRFLRSAQPRALIILETELWPHWLRAARAQSIPTALVNGRISTRAFSRYRHVSSLVGDTLKRLDLLLMRTEEDAQRVRELGAVSERVRVTGDLKAGPGLLDVARERAVLRERYHFGAEAPVLVAGSTDEGEEEIVLEVHRRLRERFPTLRLVVAPRQPTRFEEVWKVMAQTGEAIRASCLNGPPEQPVSLVLLDTMGDLARHYAAADVAFVGGSFTSRGGQNLLEPAQAGCPVLYGPHVENWTEAADSLEAEGGAHRCDDPEQLENRLDAFLRDERARRRAGQAARRAASIQANALERTVEELLPLVARGATKPATPS